MKPKRYPIALNLPVIVALLIVFARRIVQAMTGNAWFPTPTIPLNTVTNDIDALEVSEASVLAKTKGAAAARDLKQKVVVDDLMTLKAYVATIVALNIGSALLIIESAGMSLKRFTARQKAALAAAMGGAPGLVFLTAKAAGRHVAYEWQCSGDGGKTWMALPMTNVANTRAPGLTVGTTYMFSVRTTVKNVTSEWFQPLSFLVH